jgi:hypothetical protein
MFLELLEEWEVLYLQINLSKRSGDKELFNFNFSLSKYNEFIETKWR